MYCKRFPLTLAGVDATSRLFVLDSAILPLACQHRECEIQRMQGLWPVERKDRDTSQQVSAPLPVQG
jgi:hypothetical protein